MAVLSVAAAIETLIRAQESITNSIERITEDEDPDIVRTDDEPMVMCCVVYSIMSPKENAKSHNIFGQISTREPSWITQKMLEQAADELGDSQKRNRRKDE